MFEIISVFLLGLVIFLYGLNTMREGFERLAGKHLQEILLRFTKTPFRGFLTGTFTTALLQSSTAVTVLTIGFVHAGILSFSQSIGIILGTNIGTTITTQILALHIEDLALPLLLIGFTLRLLPWPNVKKIGPILSGFGCLFLGIKLIQSLIQPLEEKGWIDSLMQSSGNPILLGLLISILITALIHSSSATIAITMGFYASGLVSLPFALAVVYGSNIGTCVTGLMAAFRTSIHAKRVAISHLILNVLGAMVFTPLIPFYIDWIPYLADQPSVQLAHVQTIFNIICSIAVLPFTDAFAKLIIWLVPERNKVWKWEEYLHIQHQKKN
jgi:phosphate:Na+ symporter